MSMQQLTNPSGVFGETAAAGYAALPVVSNATAASTIHQVVRLSSGLTDGFKFDVVAALGATDVIGVLDANCAVGGTALVATRGVHLISLATGAVPVRGDLLVTSSSKAGAVKVSTYAAAAEPAGAVVAICLSSTNDASGSFCSALLKLV